MKLTKSSGFGNTAIVGNITYRMVGTYGITVALGLLLFRTPLFRWNIPAIIAYVALASIVIGQTPTQRAIMWNLYGIVLKKPVRQVVSNDTTLDRLGHGVRKVIFEDDLEVPAFKMIDNNYALVYNVTSGITQWSEQSEYRKQAGRVKTLFNILEGGEGLQIVTKHDSDTGMLQLAEHLKEKENFEGDDLQALSDQRAQSLHNVATQDVGRSVQQYAILKVKPKNVGRTRKALMNASRIMTPASNPVDVLLSAMGLEGGVEQREESDQIVEKEG